MTNNPSRTSQSGNALFLILIAVILFAALSYAITQSNRGGGAPNRETSLISSTTVTQYSSAIRTGVTRLLLRNVEQGNITFEAPTEAAFTSLSATAAKNNIYHPEGGGVSYSPVDQNTVVAITAGQTATQNDNWHFVEAIVGGIGTGGTDLVAMLDHVKKPICERINEQINGNTTIPVIASASTDLLAAGNSLITGTGISGKPFLCVETTGSRYIYYHVISEQ